MSTASLRSLREDDVAAALTILRGAVPVAFHAALVSVVESAAFAPSAEQRGLVAEVDGDAVAIAVYGEFAGTAGAGRLHLVAVAERHRRQGLGALLLDRIAEELSARATRFTLAELPDERPTLDDYFAFLGASGFTEESRIPDFYRDGVAVVFLRRG